MTYTRWIFHGEAFSADESNHAEYKIDDDDFEEGNPNNDNVQTMVDDLEGSSDRGPNEPNLYAKLIEEAKRELHKGCNTTTRLSFIIRMLYIK
jgi:hypothetical protein